MRSLNRPIPRRSGFTIVESMVVLAIMAICMALVLPALQRAREAERLVQCKDNLKRPGLALQNYHDTHDRFPYSTTCSLYGPANPNEGHTWVEFMFPYMDMSLVYLKLDFNSPITNEANSRVIENLRLPWLSCPSNEFSEKMHDIKGNVYVPWTVKTQGEFYAPCTGSQSGEGNNGYDCHDKMGLGAGTYCCTAGSDWDNAAPSANPGVFGGRNHYSCTIKDITDGVSSTFIMGERRAELLKCGAFTVSFPGAPTIMFLNSRQLNLDEPADYGHNWGFSSKHEGGAHFLLVDGQVRFISDTIEYKIYCWLGDKADGNQVKDF